MGKLKEREQFVVGMAAFVAEELLVFMILFTR